VLTASPTCGFAFFEAGGSWLPWCCYTLDRVWRIEPQCARCSVAPSELIARIAWSPSSPTRRHSRTRSPRWGARTSSSARTTRTPVDYPTTAAGIEEMAGLSEADRAGILGGNLARLLALV